MRYLKILPLLGLAGCLEAHHGDSKYHGLVGLKVLMDKVCHQYGYSTEVLSQEKVRQRQATNFYAYLLEVQERYQDQVQCHGVDKAATLVKHITKENNLSIPKVMGATFSGPQYLIPVRSKDTFYNYQGKRDYYTAHSRLGMTTNRVPVNTDHPSGWLDVSRALAEIKNHRLGGWSMVWIALYLKEDCCSAREMPKRFREGLSQPYHEGTVYRRVEDYVYEVATELVTRSELPIMMWEFGNEVDGGFWTDFDASENYDGPPRDQRKTNEVFKAARRGLNRAYADQGLGEPYHQLHVMPGGGWDLDFAKRLVDGFLVNDYDGKPLFDNVSFSIYPNARSTRDPESHDDYILALANHIGLPWSTSEFGFVQELSPGNDRGWAWNHNTNYGELCPRLYGRTCNSLYDLQALWMEHSLRRYAQDPKYYGAIHLSPGTAIANILNGSVHQPARMYRMGLWKFLKDVPYNAQISTTPLPAAFALKKASDELLAPKLHRVNAKCGARLCALEVIGEGFLPSTRLEFLERDGKVAGAIHSNAKAYRSPTRMYVPISKFWREGVAEDGLRVRVVNDRIDTDALESAPMGVENL